ncbi:DctP family TRAP transporter solute-binding subunit [Wukongibacter baidiensis]|uniref:DctP family TRAP transporter solute-binding subunit n=1 Tax=Wukongibacter baidiensis TaxID=1723361 RepID=UPI003D7FBFF6
MKKGNLFKRGLAVLLMGMVVAGLFVGCGAKSDTKVDTESGDLGSYEIRISAANSESHPQTLGLYAMKEYVEKESNGKLTISVFSNGQLGDEDVSLEQVQAGTLEMATASIAPVATFQKKFFALDIPFLFDTYEEAWMVMDSSVGIDLLDSLDEVGLKGLAYMENGFRHITTDNKEVKALKDLEGLKIRTMNSPMHIKNFQALDSNPTPVPFSELYMAMSQNIVNGQENPIANIWDVNMYEVQSYVSLTGHIYDAMPLVTNLKWWNELPPQYQTIIQKGAILGQNYSRFCNYEREDILKAKLEEKGMTVVEVSKEAKDEMRAASQDVVADAVKKEVGEETISNFLNGIENVKKDIVKGIQ